MVFVEVRPAGFLHPLPDTLVLQVVHILSAGSEGGWARPPGLPGEATLCQVVEILRTGTAELQLQQTQLLALGPARHPGNHAVVLPLQQVTNCPLVYPGLLTGRSSQTNSLEVSRPGVGVDDDVSVVLKVGLQLVAGGAVVV